MKARKAREYVFGDLLGMETHCQNHYAEYYSKSMNYFNGEFLEK